MVRKCLGGVEASPVAAIKIVETRHANGSAGWVVMAIGLEQSLALTLFSLLWRRRFRGCEPETALPMMA
jgi:hypothetical protein